MDIRLLVQFRTHVGAIRALHLGDILQGGDCTRKRPFKMVPLEYPVKNQKYFWFISKIFGQQKRCNNLKDSAYSISNWFQFPIYVGIGPTNSFPRTLLQIGKPIYQEIQFEP